MPNDPLRRRSVINGGIGLAASDRPAPPLERPPWNRRSLTIELRFRSANPSSYCRRADGPEAPSPPAGFEEEREWARSYWGRSFPLPHECVRQLLDDEGEKRIREAYAAQKHDRLKSLKRKYDKTNFSPLNQNISPDYN